MGAFTDDIKAVQKEQFSFRGMGAFEKEVSRTTAQQAEAEPFVPFTEEEKQNHPILYELNKGASFTAKMALSMVPFLRFALPEVRTSFKYLDFGEQVTSLAWEGFGALLLGGPSVFKKASDAMRVASRMAKTPIPLLTRAAGEEAGWRFFSMQAAREGVLRSQFHFRGPERKAILKYLRKDKGALTAYEMDQTLAGGSFTKAWEKHTARPSGVPYAQRMPSDEVLAAIDKSQKSTLRHLYRQREWNKGMREAGFLDEKIKGLDWADKAFQRQAEHFGSNVTLATATEREVATFFANMLESPNRVKGILTPGGFWPSLISPMRIIFGKMDRIWGAKEKVFDMAADAFHGSRLATSSFLKTGFELFQRRGFGKLSQNAKTGETLFTFAPQYTGKVYEAAFRLISESEKIMMEAGQRAASRAPRSAAQILARARKQSATLLKDPIFKQKEVQDLFFAWKDFGDHLYGTRATWKIGTLLEEMPLDLSNEAIRLAVDSTRRYASSELGKYFLSPMLGGRPFSAAEKIEAVERVLARVKNDIAVVFSDAFEVGNKVGGERFKAIEGIVRKFETELSVAKRPFDKGNWIPYHEGYFEHISTKQRGLDLDLLSQLAGGNSTFYQELQSLPGLTEPITDLNSLFLINSRQLAKEMNLYPDLVAAIKDASLMPKAVREVTEHLTARMLNIPSRIDADLGHWASKTVGVLSQKVKQLVGKGGKAVPKTDIQGAREISEFVQTINDYAYMGAFGFRPFSAMRNMFQPFINVPADLGGGILDTVHLAKGLKTMFSPAGKEARAYIRKIGAITEYAPEIFVKKGFFPSGKEVTLGGKLIRLPTRDRVRDTLTTLFRASDRFNRHLSGMAAMSKWDAALAKVGPLTESNLSRFMKESGASLRQEWETAKLAKLLKNGQFDTARAEFVKDVIADTQYLYGIIDAPYISGKWGSVGRAGIVFQSWMMNYGSLMEKWLRTGEASDKVRRMATWMFTGFALDEVATQFWGEGTAERMTLFGPFPREMQIPPAFAPLFYGTRAFLAGLDTAVGRDPKYIDENIRRFVDSFVIFIPAGLQAKQLWMGGKKEGFEGVAKGVLKLKPPSKDYPGPVFGLFR
uniref:Large polyvalent protein associated domain-containing protein n=1 Tax=viral metagenome TaxID=1070528 RepID=A0A6M3XDT8_9ZZZZ